MSASLCRWRRVSLPGARGRCNVFACEPEWAALADGARRRQGQGLRRDQRAAGPASHRGEAEPHRAGAQRRPARLHRHGARDRLAAAADSSSRATRTSRPGSPAISRPAASSRRSRCRRGSTAAKATCMPPAIRTSSPIRATSRTVADRARRAARRSSTRPNAAYYQARYKSFEARWSAAIAKLGAAGRAAARRAGGRAPQELDLPDGTGSACARSATLEPKPGVEPSAALPDASCIATLAQQPAKMVVRAAYQSARVAVARRAREARGGRAAVHRRRRRPGERPVRPVRRHASRCCCKGGAMSCRSVDLSILLPAFVAGVLVLATHVPLGAQVLARGIVFIDLAIAQIAGCGVLVADAARRRARGLAGAGRGRAGRARWARCC